MPDLFDDNKPQAFAAIPTWIVLDRAISDTTLRAVVTMAGLVAADWISATALANALGFTDHDATAEIAAILHPAIAAGYVRRHPAGNHYAVNYNREEIAA